MGDWRDSFAAIIWRNGCGSATATEWRIGIGSSRYRGNYLLAWRRSA